MAAALLVPAAAQAKTKTVYVGRPGRDQEDLQAQATDANAFFPAQLTVNAGDSVKFVPAGFHTVDIPKKGGGAAAAARPDGQKVAGVDRRRRRAVLVQRPGRAGPQPGAVRRVGFGKKFTYTGAKRIESGAAARRRSPSR